MTPKQLKQIELVVGKAIQQHVNGKIDKIDKKIDDYIKSDNEWKAEADPYLKGLANLTGGAKIIVWVAIGVSALIGAVLAIRKLF